MRFKKFRVEFNSEESVEFLADMNTTSIEGIERAISSFKNTKEYAGDWDDDDFFEHLIEEGIVLIPISQIKTLRTFNIREV